LSDTKRNNFILFHSNYDIEISKLIIEREPTIIILIGLYTLLKKNSITQLVFINLFTIFLGLIIFLVKTNNHNLIKQINIGSGLFSVFSLIMYTNYSKILLIFLISIMFKLQDTYNFNNYDLFISGTAWFHIKKR